MKKRVSVFLVLSILVVCLCGCMGNSEYAKTTIEETLVYDENGISITVTGLDVEMGEVELGLRIENGSDRSLYITTEAVSVNGISVYGYAYVMVSPGKKANDKIYIDAGEMEDAGIEQIASITVHDLVIYDDDSFDSETGNYSVLDRISFSVAPADGSDYVQQIDESGDVIFADSGLTVIAREYKDTFWGKSIGLMIKNETGESVIVSSEDVSVNDYMMGSYLWETVCDGTVRYCVLELYDSDLEDNDIENVEKVAFSLELMELENYETIWRTPEMEIIISEP